MKRVAAKLEAVMKVAPKILANEGQKLFNENFRNQSFQGTKWPNVQRRISGTFEYKYPKTRYTARRTNPILIGKTRRLKNAVNRSVKSVSNTRIVWGVSGTEGKYGAFHNYGIGQKPRPFMRADKVLRARLMKKFQQIIKSTK